MTIECSINFLQNFLWQNNTRKLSWQVFGVESATLCLHGIAEDEEIMRNAFKIAGVLNICFATHWLNMYVYFVYHFYCLLWEFISVGWERCTEASSVLCTLWWTFTNSSFIQCMVIWSNGFWTYVLELH